MLTVKEWDKIRRAYHVEEKSIREIARETGHARRTVKRMVEADEPPRYRRQEPYRAHKLGPFKQRIQELLAENQVLPHILPRHEGGTDNPEDLITWCDDCHIQLDAHRAKFVSKSK